MQNPNCHKCIYRGNVAGDTHSCCKHPAVGSDPIMAMIAMVKDRSPEIEKLNIQADPHGVKMGWFMWPANFDPIWLNNCDGYTGKKTENV